MDITTKFSEQIEKKYSQCEFIANVYKIQNLSHNCIRMISSPWLARHFRTLRKRVAWLEKEVVASRLNVASPHDKC